MGIKRLISIQLCVVLIVVTGCTHILQSTVNETEAKAAGAAIMAWAVVVDKGSVSPDTPAGPTMVCPMCDGTGQTGDGVHSVVCGTCKGTGKVAATGYSNSPQESFGVLATDIHDQADLAQHQLPPPVDNMVVEHVSAQEQQAIENQVIENQAAIAARLNEMNATLNKLTPAIELIETTIKNHQVKSDE